jgi:hypothetical protein
MASVDISTTGAFKSNGVVVGGGGTEIGALIGGGVVVAVFNDSGVNKALVASLTNLSVGIVWSPIQATIIGATAQSYSNGLTNTNAIIAQTGAAATTAYAAGLARLFAGGGFNDWYLPSNWELNIVYNSAGITNKIAGVTGLLVTTQYWSSTESTANAAWNQGPQNGNIFATNKGTALAVRAVRIHTI